MTAALIYEPACTLTSKLCRVNTSGTPTYPLSCLSTFFHHRRSLSSGKWWWLVLRTSHSVCSQVPQPNAATLYTPILYNYTYEPATLYGWGWAPATLYGDFQHDVAAISGLSLSRVLHLGKSMYPTFSLFYHFESYVHLLVHSTIPWQINGYYLFVISVFINFLLRGFLFTHTGAPVIIRSHGYTCHEPVNVLVMDILVMNQWIYLSWIFLSCTGEYTCHSFASSIFSPNFFCNTT